MMKTTEEIGQLTMIMKFDAEEVVLLKLVDQLTLDIVWKLLSKRSLPSNPSRLRRLNPAHQHKCCMKLKVHFKVEIWQSAIFQ